MKFKIGDYVRGIDNVTNIVYTGRIIDIENTPTDWASYCIDTIQGNKWLINDTIKKVEGDNEVKFKKGDIVEVIKRDHWDGLTYYEGSKWEVMGFGDDTLYYVQVKDPRQLNGYAPLFDDYVKKVEGDNEMKESQFSKQVVKYLKEKGALVNVNTANMFDKVGRSDVECCYKGHWISLELKVGNYQPDPLQISYLHKVRDANGFGLLLRDNLHDLAALLYCIDNGIERQYQQPKLPDIKIGEIEFD